MKPSGGDNRSPVSTHVIGKKLISWLGNDLSSAELSRELRSQGQEWSCRTTSRAVEGITVSLMSTSAVSTDWPGHVTVGDGTKIEDSIHTCSFVYL